MRGTLRLGKMKRNRWLTISLVLLVAAVVAQGYAQSCAARATGLNARAAQARVNHEDAATIGRMNATADLLLARISLFVGIGAPLAIVGMVAWGFAFRRKEPGWKLLPVAPLVIYVLLSIIQV